MSDQGHPAGEVGETLLSAAKLARVASEALDDGRVEDALSIAHAINDMLEVARLVGLAQQDALELVEWLRQ